MKLSYRGTKYDAKPTTIATYAGKVIGKYRGAELHERIAHVS
ncbi:MAG: DUF4278 domain-containing protein [Synechococcales cyanobacterium C42_A2020_086]|jgi:hypothetical protein|nr:DUF4278 domain-containing protein [Synechococcales cyanobacterium M58_A2018_015]MBF2074280.1 DUF4278 domain-containing protein [Synechococcales cyanobacterium C42_A2020_086]